MNTRHDVIIAGAGPAGSTTAALLAQQGWDVLVLERETFPRFHVGESLLPAALPAMARIGLEPPAETLLFKRGAEFICEATGRSAAFDFAEALDGPPRHAWHVERATFDTQVRDAARDNGATVEHGVRVRDFAVDGDGVTVTTDGATHRARYFVDATGQGRLVAKREKAVLPYRRFGRAAVFAHWDGLSDDAIAEIGPGADIRIMMVEDGWAWVIPLPGRRLSIGRVSRAGGITKDDLPAYVEGSPLLSRWTAGATRGDVHIVSNFSYRNGQPHGARFGCVGDAACFLDPVFSSGVALAMSSAEQLADRLHEALRDGTEADPELMADLDARMEQGYEVFASMIDRFYNSRFVDNMIFGVPPDGELKPAVTSVLAGDVWRDDNPFADMLRRSRRRAPAPARVEAAAAP